MLPLPRLLPASDLERYASLILVVALSVFLGIWLIRLVESCKCQCHLSLAILLTSRSLSLPYFL